MRLSGAPTCVAPTNNENLYAWSGSRYALPKPPHPMRSFNEITKNLLEQLGFSLHRWPPNRFQAMSAGLAHLRASGYSPDVVIDAGANVGEWTRAAKLVFPRAEYHLIEPQPDCVEQLQLLPGVRVHPVAITRPGISEVRMAGSGSGASVTADAGLPVPATTLDELMPGLSGRVLLKLDLETHEPIALMGAVATLQRVDVIISETMLFSHHDALVPFAEYLRLVESHGFMVFDIVSMSGRRRDNRLRTCDVIFVRKDSALASDVSWE